MKVEGGDKLAVVQMIAEETARKHMREAALAGAEVIRAEVEDRAPRKNRRLGRRYSKRGQEANKKPG